MDVAETGQGDGTAEVPSVVGTSVDSAPQDLPTATIGIAIHSSTLRVIESPSILHEVESFPETFLETFVEVPAGTPFSPIFSSPTCSSPTFSISTISDLTPTELDEDIGDNGGALLATHHDTFYFEDGNVEVMCRETVFRVHSTAISFSSPRLRDILSPSTLLNAPMPEGRPRIIAEDNSEDFAVLLKMIYTPGWVFFYIKVDSVD